MCDEWVNNNVVQRLREYLRIPSVHPNIDYGDCVTFLKKQAELLGLPVQVHELVPKKPVVVITWKGIQPDLPAILLNSHMDVVPVYEEHWTHPPFEAKVLQDGFIYARGIQDMKGVGMAQLEAVRRLKETGVRLKRTVHLSFVPDEEIGGQDGMRKFSESEEFKALNIGFALDESVPSTDPNTVIMFNGERTSRQIKVTCRGNPGHGSLLVSDTAGEKLHYIIDKFMKYRAEQKNKLDAYKEKAQFMTGEFITINLTQVEGGVQVNVLPENLSVTFDIRIAPHVDHEAFENMIETWCTEAGEGVTFEYIVKNPQIKSTKTDGSEPFWDALAKSVKEMGLNIACIICPGATDARFVRHQGIPAINFTPFVNTPFLLHAHDERMNINEYKKGINVMQKALESVANI